MGIYTLQKHKPTVSCVHGCRADSCGQSHTQDWRQETWECRFGRYHTLRFMVDCQGLHPEVSALWPWAMSLGSLGLARWRQSHCSARTATGAISLSRAPGETAMEKTTLLVLHRGWEAELLVLCWGQEDSRSSNTRGFGWLAVSR